MLPVGGNATIKSMELFCLKNGRNFRNHLVSKSNILCGFSWCGNRIIKLCIEFLDKTTGQEPFFRDDYRKEIDPLLDFFNNLMGVNYPYDSALSIVFRHNQLTGKRVLQHLYTCEKTRELYEIIKNYYETKTKEPNQAEFFRSKFKPIWLDMKKSVNPDFGACDECIKHIRLKHIQKHKKTLKNCDDSMWNFIFD